MNLPALGSTGALPPVERSRNLRSTRFLIVDDDAGDRMQIKRAIRQMVPPPECVEAVSIAEGLEACEHSEFDLVIVDYRLPGEDGLAGIVVFRERFPLLPIVMSTGQGDEKVAIEAMKRGASDYISKTSINAESISKIIQGSLQWAEREVEMSRRQDRLQYLGLHDSLTGLPNRTLFTDRLDQLILTSLRKGDPFCLLMMDLNFFKEVNDTMGHEAGDAVLCQIAQRLAAAIRKSDTVARLGGDEFACLLPMSQHSETTLAARQVAEKILEAVRIPMLIQNRAVTVGISVGIALFPLHGTDGRTLMQCADQAMYQAKQGARGVQLFSPRLQDKQSPSAQLNSSLMQAVESGELVLHFQPQVDMKSRRIIGKEALVRWNHPEQGMISPDRFLPAAERSPAINALTMAVLRMALDEEQRWRTSGFRVPISVNMPPRLLDDDSLCTSILQMLGDRNLPSDCLIVELTETALASSPLQARNTLKRMSDAGIRISIDDFGSGYTSYRQLRELEIAEIKIDGSYVVDLAETGRDASIVRSIVELGRGFRIHIIAECVESDKSWSALRSLGCHSAQGFRVGRPMPAEAFDKWRRDWARAIPPSSTALP